MTVHIKSFCKDMDLLSAAVLTLHTIRVGFPDARVIVHADNTRLGELDRHVYNVVLAALCEEFNANYVYNSSSHASWIQSLVATETSPFYICDSDVVFFDRVPDAWSRGVWAGEVQPLFNDPFSRAAHMERLHTALMYISPVALRARIAAWQEKTRRHELTPTINLFEPAIIPSPNGHALFYDTCAFLYHAVGADVFDAPENVFAHLHCGTWVKEADEVIPNLRAIHEAVYADRNKAQDLRRVQAEFYRQNALS